MEEATITNSNSVDTTTTTTTIISKDRFLMVVDTDDLVWELGRKEVDRLNKEKLLESLLKQKVALRDSVAIVQDRLPKMQEELTFLRESVSKYENTIKSLQEANSSLSASFEDSSQLFTAPIAPLKEAKEKLLAVNSNLDKALVEQRTTNSRLSSENAGLLIKCNEIEKENLALKEQKEDLSSKLTDLSIKYDAIVELQAVAKSNKKQIIKNKL